MTEQEIDQGLQDICRTTECHRGNYVYDDRQALMLCAQAVVETLREVRDQLADINAKAKDNRWF